MERTKVTFRKLDGDIIALFPDEVSHGGVAVRSLEVYGDCNVPEITDWYRVEPEEYADLLTELERVGYDLEVVE